MNTAMVQTARPHPRVPDGSAMPMTETALAPQPLPRLLLVDDEASLREPLASYLERQGFVVRAAASAAEARVMLAEEVPDLVLLDIMMPGEDGLSLCRHLSESCAIPTILLTARGEADDRISGLEIGADDYVVKPFEPRELVARIRSVLRRAARGGAEPASEEDFLFEGWRLDPLKRRLIDSQGAVVAISSVEFRLLLAFLERDYRKVAEVQFAAGFVPRELQVAAAKLVTWPLRHSRRN